ncbi:MAG TPA: hypothetical protein VII65_03730 [Acidimicrobiales bacterium]
MKRGVIFPELVSGRDDEVDDRPWTVQEGSTMRGSASCNLSQRILEVPYGPGAQARVVRAHELMHARVSPHAVHLMKALSEVSPRALECSEEFRVNTLLARLNFDVALLSDGTEKLGGRRLGEAGEWAEAVCFFVAVLGTGAEKAFLAGIRQSQAPWLGALRAIGRRVMVHTNQLSTKELGATNLNDEGLPSGYVASTLALARLLTQSMSARVPTTPEELRAFRRSLESGGRRPATGQFATLVFDTSLTLVPRPRATSVRRVRPTATGAILRYPGRLLTDTQRRAFSQKTTRHGGVVIIDQSGSMDLSPNALRDILRSAPSALVVAYSHRPGDVGSTPNAWILVERGKIATTCPTGNVGNGVDGPILQWALSQRCGHEPVVWVTDGQVTDSHDHPDEVLTQQCANLVRRHRIRLVRDLGGAPRALRLDAPTAPSQLSTFGRVGRRLRESTEMKGF